LYLKREEEKEVEEEAREKGGGVWA